MRKEMTIEALALKKLREIKGLDRKQAAVLLGMSFKSIEKFENGRTILTKIKINEILAGYDFTQNDFELCCQGKFEQVKNRLYPKKILESETRPLRRSYQKIITKEIKTLTVLRKLRGYNQYRAGRVCGYSNCTIGHIENGRFELSPSRIRHIVESYGFDMADFEYHLKSDQFVTDIQDNCITIIKNLNEEKLKIVNALLQSFKK